MEKKPIYLAFATQKGGAGKTTLTVLVASYLHYVKGYDVAVIDCDYPQYTLAMMRNRDLKMALEDEYFKGLAYEQYTRLGKQAYPVIESNTKEAIADAEYLIPQGDFDYILFDLPGTINDADMLYTTSSMDYIIAPITADRFVLESTLDYILIVKDHLMKLPESKIKALRVVWNMVDGREKTDLYDVYGEALRNLGFTMLKSYLPDTKRFRKEQTADRNSVFRSTLFPPDRALIRGSNIDKLTDELIALCKKTSINE